MGQGVSAACCICMENKGRGVRCKSSEHFTCKECFPQYISSTCENAGRLCDHSFLIRCPYPTCKSAPFSTADLRTYLDGDTLDVYINTLVRYCGKVSEGQDLAKIRHESLSTRITNALNLTCPKCKLVLDHNPDGCCAMRCSGCAVYFCWLCFKTDTSNFACHRHVASCAMNPSGNLFAPKSVWKAAHKVLRIQRIRSILSEAHNDVRMAWTAAPQTLNVLRDLTPLLAQSHISPSEVLAGKRGRHDWWYTCSAWYARTIGTHVERAEEVLVRLLATPEGAALKRTVAPVLRDGDAVVRGYLAPGGTRQQAYSRLAGVLLVLWLVLFSGTSSSSSALKYSGGGNHGANHGTFSVRDAASVPRCPPDLMTCSAAGLLEYHYVLPSTDYHQTAASASGKSSKGRRRADKLQQAQSSDLHYVPLVAGAGADADTGADNSAHQYQHQLCLEDSNLHLYSVKQPTSSGGGGGGGDSKSSSSSRFQHPAMAANNENSEGGEWTLASFIASFCWFGLVAGVAAPVGSLTRETRGFTLIVSGGFLIGYALLSVVSYILGMLLAHPLWVGVAIGLYVFVQKTR